MVRQQEATLVMATDAIQVFGINRKGGLYVGLISKPSFSLSVFGAHEPEHPTKYKRNGGYRERDDRDSEPLILS